MGLSLRNITKKIGDVVGGVEQGVQHGIGGLVGSTIVNPVRELTAQATNNPVAYQHAQQAQNRSIQDVQNLTAPILRTIPETLTTIAHPTSQFTYHPRTPLEQALFTKTPVQNIQKKVATNYNTHPNLNPLARVGLAGLEGVGSIAQDAPVVGTAAKLAKLKGIEGVGDLGMSTKDVSPALPPETPKNIPAPVKPVVKAGKGSAPPDFLATDKGYVPKSPAELADLSPKEQMALTQPKVELAPAEANTAANPYKSIRTNVAPGDYKGAIANSQLVSRPIETAASVWQNTMKSLTPDERTNFWRAVEKPDGNYSPNLKAAISQWRDVDNKVHGESQALGGNTNYLTNHNLHPWQLPEEYTNHIVSGGSPSSFKGVNNISRKYQTIAEGEANGLTIGTDPISEGTRYLQANASILRKQALKQGLAQADSLAEKQPHSLDLGGGHTIPLSDEGMRASKSLQRYLPSANPMVKGVRTVNQGAKSTILSLGQFHTINIGALRAAPSLILEGHPVAAAKGLYGMFRGAFGTQYADNVIGKALKDGTVDKAAQIGMPYGGSGYDMSGTFLKHGVGSKTVFGKQIPMMHDQVVRSIISDLDKKGVPLDSPEAREAGLAGANMMGELNSELQNISPRVKKTMSDWMLAGQFTPSKFIQMGRAVSKGGVGGSYARANVLANVAATTAVVAGLGYVFKQKSDDVKDMLLRALVDPAVPTPMKDAKGNTVKLRTPGTDTSDIAKLLGITLVRGSDGHLGVDWNVHNAPSTVADFLRARLSPIGSAGIKLVTNTNYAGKPLYNPDAPAGTKAIQGATSIVTGNLPIGLQGLAYTNTVKSKLPGSAQAVLNASTPGTDPLVKSVGSSFGLTPSTDQTVGKGQQTAQYFDTKDKFLGGLDPNEKTLFNKLNPTKTDGFGNPIYSSNVLSKPSDWADLQANPGFLSKYVGYERNQPSHDPIWDLNQSQLNAYINLQKIKSALPGSTSQFSATDANYIKTTEDSDWYQNLQQSRSNFYNHLQAQGVKLNSKSSTTQASPEVQSVLDQMGTPGVNTSTLLAQNPAAEQWLSLHASELNQQRTDQGLPPLPVFPTAPNAAIQAKDVAYSQLPSGTGARSAFLKANPDYQAFWQQKQDYYTALDGSNSTTSNYSSGYGGSKYVSKSQAEMENPANFNVDINAGGSAKVAKLKKGGKVKLAQLSGKRSIAVKGRPTVKLTKSLV